MLFGACVLFLSVNDSLPKDTSLKVPKNFFNQKCDLYPLKSAIAKLKVKGIVIYETLMVRAVSYTHLDVYKRQAQMSNVLKFCKLKIDKSIWL